MKIQQLKIVLINKHVQDSLGGSEIQCDIIGNELTKLGHVVTYIAIDGFQEIYNTLYKVIPVKQNSRIILNKVINEKPDIVYWRFNKNNLKSIVKTLNKKGIPIVFGISSLEDTQRFGKFRPKNDNGNYLAYFISNLKRSIISLWNYSGFKYVDGITTLNKDYIGILPVTIQKYIPNSMYTDFDEFKWTRPFVIWVANLKTHKRPEICIDLARAIDRLGVDVIMVGKIQDSTYSNFQNKSEIPNNLHYLGTKSVKEVNGILKESICLVHTCTPEGFGNNFIQAWLQEKPTISLEFDPGGLIRRYNMGLVSNNSVERFIKDVIRIIEDNGQSKKLGDNAKIYARKNHHPKINVQELNNFLYKVIEFKGGK